MPDLDAFELRALVAEKYAKHWLSPRESKQLSLWLNRLERLTGLSRAEIIDAARQDANAMLAAGC